MNNLNNKSNKKISQLKLDVIKFDSLDVIATSMPLFAAPLQADDHELIANLTNTEDTYFSTSYYTDPTSPTPGYYYEPTSGQ